MLLRRDRVDEPMHWSILRFLVFSCSFNVKVKNRATSLSATLKSLQNQHTPLFSMAYKYWHGCFFNDTYKN